jgi:hypothetical protein
MKSLINDVNYEPHFSGHETFPLRQMWLKKAFDAVHSGKKSIFTNVDAIVDFGVGKNMVGSIRHWAMACGIIESVNGSYRSTELGEKLFGNKGIDQYSEKYGTSWIAHWNLAGHSKFGARATTWFLAFNQLGEYSFSPSQLLSSIDEYLEKKSPRIKVSPNTLARDVNIFFSTYVSKSTSASLEDIAEPMLAELGLLQVGANGLYEFCRGPKPTLPDNVFLYSLIDFWTNAAPNQKTLSFESVSYDPGSPGRVFKLDEDSLAERLMGLDKLTHGDYQWSDTAGQKQIICKSEVTLMQALEVK